MPAIPSNYPILQSQLTNITTGTTFEWHNSRIRRGNATLTTAVTTQYTCRWLPVPFACSSFKMGSLMWLYGKGDLSVQPSKVPLFAHWHGNDHCLQIQIADQFIKRVAQEALDMDVDRLELLPGLKLRDPQIESISRLLLAELKSDNIGGQLYIDSVANLLAVHLLKMSLRASFC